MAKAFEGTPVAEGVAFAELRPHQQAAFQAIAKTVRAAAHGGDLLDPAFKSYGLPCFAPNHLERYIARKDVWGREET